MAEQEQVVDGEKKSYKKLIIIISAVLLLIGAAAGGYFFLDSGDTADESEAEKKASVPAEPAVILYYDFASPLIVNFPSGSKLRLMQVSISVMVDSQNAIEALKKHDPMIRSNLLMLISAQNSDDLVTREGKDSLREAIHKEVGQTLEKMTGHNSVKDVFFTSFVMQ